MSAIDAFVGRVRELSSLRGALERVIDGQGTLVLVSGEAGIGKTSLVRELRRDAREQNLLVLTGRCFDLSAALPYGPWLDIADRFLEIPDLPNVPEVLRRGTDVGDIASQTELFEVASTFLADVAATRPLVIVLEDLHWSDHASLALLRYVARKIASHRILLIATYRVDEVTRENPLYLMLPALVRESDAERISLPPLDSNTISELLHAGYSLPATEQARLTTYLRNRAEGNPLFTIELLRTLELEHVLRKSSAGWTLDALTSTTVPSFIQQTVDARLSTLPESSKAAIRDAAVIGQFVSFSQWEMITDPAHIIDTIEEGINSHLLVETEDGDQLAFRHALVHEAVYLSIPLIQRRELHRKLADSLIHQGQIDPDGIAYHLQKAGDARAAEWLIEAGERAERSFAWIEAVNRYRDAVDILERDPKIANGSAGPLLRIGRLLRFSNPEHGLEYLRRAHLAAVREEEKSLSMHALFNIGLLECILGNQRIGLPKMKSAVDALDELTDENEPITRWALTLLPGNVERPYPLVLVNGTLALWLAAVGKHHEAIAVAERYFDPDWQNTTFDFHDEQEHPRFDIDGLHGLGIALASLGRTEESRLAFTLAAEYLQIQTYHPLSLLVTHSWLAFLHFPFRTNYLNERYLLTEVMEDRWQRIADEWRHANNWMWELLYFYRGEWGQLELLAESIPIKTIPVSVYRDMATRARTRLAYHQGNHDHAWSMILALFPEGPSSEPGGHLHMCATDAQRVAVAMSLESGNLENARLWLEAHDRWLDWSEAVLGRADGKLLWAQLHLAEGDVALAEESAQQALTLASDPRQPLVLIAIHRFLGELSTSRLDLNSAKTHLQQSLELTNACALPFERALTTLAIAEFEIVTGDKNAAAAHLREVRQVCAQVGAHPTLKRVTAIENVIRKSRDRSAFGLTSRELEVLRLLSQGMSDREIADHLFISHHTVMRHVSHILGKLGVESRTAAVAKAVREVIN